MNILGIFGSIDWDAREPLDENENHTYLHDAGATLFVDGKLSCSIQEERLTRYKFDGNFPYKSIEYCLSQANIKNFDIDIVYLSSAGNSLFYEKEKDKTLYKFIENIFPNAIVKIISHHLCHAASSIFTSSFNEGTFFTLDGEGSDVKHPVTEDSLFAENNSMGYFNKSKKILRFFPLIPNFNIFGKYHFTKSLHIFYKKINSPLPKNQSAEVENVSGKVMGLGAYGNYKNSSKWKEYFIDDSYHMPFVHFYYHDENDLISAEDNASVLQKNFECALLDYLKILKERSYFDENICFAGGCFLNVLTNSLIKKSNFFKDIHIPPFTNDSGLSFGAAAYAVFIHESKNEIEIPKNLSLLSKKYSNDEIEQEIKNFNLSYKKYDDFKELCNITAQKLEQNKIIGWFQNSSESGPRSLGSRSILMSPKDKKNKDILNFRVKHREYWRPFAGSVLEEHLSEYVDDDFISPYMLYSYKVKDEKISEIPSLVHKDNTCRIQTIKKSFHPEFHSLLDSFYKVSKIPIILNTSFNDNGEPIIESPKDAISSFLRMDIDYLVIGNFILSKTVKKLFKYQ